MFFTLHKNAANFMKWNKQCVTIQLKAIEFYVLGVLNTFALVKGTVYVAGTLTSLNGKKTWCVGIQLKAAANLTA